MAKFLTGRVHPPLAILLLTAIGVKLIGPHGGIHVFKNVCDVSGSVN